MMPSYAESRWYSLFFISYLCIVLYLLMNLVSIARNQFNLLYLSHAHLSCTKNLPDEAIPSNLTYLYVVRAMWNNSWRKFGDVVKNLHNNVIFNSSCKNYEKKVRLSGKQFDVLQSRYLKVKPMYVYLTVGVRGM